MDRMREFSEEVAAFEKQIEQHLIKLLALSDSLCQEVIYGKDLELITLAFFRNLRLLDNLTLHIKRYKLTNRTLLIPYLESQKKTLSIFEEHLEKAGFPKGDVILCYVKNIRLLSELLR